MEETVPSNIFHKKTLLSNIFHIPGDFVESLLAHAMNIPAVAGQVNLLPSTVGAALIEAGVGLDP